MSMPVITPGEGSREQAITDLVESIALQETALSHIINAEGEKIQVFTTAAGITPEQLLAANASVESMVDAITRLEMVFQTKLNLFAADLAVVPPEEA